MDGPSPQARRSKPASRRERERVLDELLVLRAQEGSRDAFRRLVERWQERLWRHAYRLTGSEDEAWEVLQESWVGVTSGIPRLRDPGAFPRWAYTIVTREATNRLRRRGAEPLAREPFVEPAADAADAAEADEADERAHAVALLRRALDRLAGPERGLLSLRYLEGFELWELAHAFDVPEGTVKSRLHHARNHLKEILERMEP